MSELESNDYVARQNQIRQAWVKEAPADWRPKFAAMPQEERFAHYASIDSKVNKAYRANVAKLRETKDRLSASETEAALAQAAGAVVLELLNS